MRWPWQKKEDPDGSWEALDESHQALRDAKSNWTHINKVVINANVAAEQVRSRREENQFRELIVAILSGRN